MSRTLAEVRKAVASRMGEVVEGVASSAIPSPASIFTDPVNLLDPKNTYAGADIIVTTGPSAGWRARVSASSLDQTSLDFTPPSPNPINIGNHALIFGGRTGMRIMQVDQAIRDAQNDAFPNHRIPWTVDDDWEFNDGFVVLPDEFTHIHTVSYANNYPPSTWTSVMPGKGGTQGWDLGPGRKLFLNGVYPSYAASGLPLRVDGYAREPEMVEDDDTTDLDLEWLIYTASAYLRAMRSGGEDMQRFGLMANKADALRGKMARPMYPNTRKVIP